MRLYIPDIGEELRLVSDWHFDTCCEERNVTLFNAFDIPFEDRWHRANQHSWRFAIVDGFDTRNPKDGVRFVIPADTILKVDRVYIRKGQEDFSSITFVIVDSPDNRLVTKKNKGLAPKQVRFWVKLKETRTIEIKDY